ncbi:hypothetical protein HN51_036685 [Arachis hypogaea]
MGGTAGAAPAAIMATATTVQDEGLKAMPSPYAFWWPRLLAEKWLCVGREAAVNSHVAVVQYTARAKQDE